MPNPDTTPTAPKTPPWLETARRFYAAGFEVRTDRALAASNTDWAELPEHEQSFTIAHLLYLNLVAQRGTQRLLFEVRDLLDETAAGVEGEEEDADEEPEPDPEPDPEDGGAASVATGAEEEQAEDPAPVVDERVPEPDVAGEDETTSEPDAPAEPVVAELIIPGEFDERGAA